MSTFAVDVSEFQVPVNDSYPYPWLIFRADDGTYRDQKFSANYAWARKAAASGKLIGYTVYAVYEPGVDIVAVVKSMVGTPDQHLTVMIDVESWGGKISGDHSAEITARFNALAAWLGDPRRVLVYGNQNDLASIYPNRPHAACLVIAAYSASKPSVPGQIGWQYSDGQTIYPHPAGWDISTAPFGPCDHDEFDLDPAALAAALGVGDTLTPDDIWNAQLHAVNPDGTAASGNHTAAAWLTGANTKAASALAQVAALAAQVTALQAAVAKLQTGGSVGTAPTAFTGTVELTAK